MVHLRALVFDLGGVLVRTEDPAPRAALAARWGLSASRLAYELLDSPLGVQAQLGKRHPQDLWRELLQRYGERELDPDEANRRFWAGDRFDEVLIAHLRYWRGRYRLGLLSNAWITLRSWLETTPLKGLFDAVVISAEEGLMKPDPRIYARILGMLEVLPQEAAFVDDRPENVEAARRLGMHAIHFQNRDQVLQDLTALGVPLLPRL